MLVFSIQTHASIFSQSLINVELKNSKLEDLVKIIEDQTSMDFLYDVSYFRNIKLISANFKNETVETVLTKVLENTGLCFEIEHKTILIKPLEAFKTLQKEKIKGVVTDDKGETLPGVSVVIKGTSIGVSTNIDGQYQIEGVSKGAILIFSFVGMNTKEITITNQTEINVTLENSSEQLGEVVVTGMVSTDKRLFTGASEKLEAEKIKLAGMPDISRALEGRSAGVSVQNVSGTFGAAP